MLSDNGPCYISDDLAKWLKGREMAHARGAPFHPQTQDKIQRWHLTMGASMISQMKAKEDKNRQLKRMCAGLADDVEDQYDV